MKRVCHLCGFEETFPMEELLQRMADRAPCPSCKGVIPPGTAKATVRVWYERGQERYVLAEAVLPRKAAEEQAALIRRDGYNEAPAAFVRVEVLDGVLD